MTRLRFAPSPTGYIHAGNLRVALVNWLFARQTGGQFLLRIDDTDLERSKSEYTAAIEEDLRWLGLNWDEEAHQSHRFAEYAKAADKLRAMGRLYACYETPDELDIQRKQLAARGLPPVYNRAGLKLTDEQKTAFESEGRKPHYRFLLEDKEVVWEDLIRGPVKMRATTMSDPVLLRGDGVPVYTLASVVDDGDLGITHVVRGEDHVSNTAVQVQLWEALGYPVPQFAHMALLKTKEGELSKRIGGNNIRQLRESGMLPMAINSLLARLGTSESIEPFLSLKPLIEGFDWKKFGRAPANYDIAELEKLNERLLKMLPYGQAKPHLPEAMSEGFWHSIRGNIKALAEADTWWRIVHDETSGKPESGDADFRAQAASLLPPEPWDTTTWDSWIAAIKERTGRKGKDLFMPLRLALTGMEHGPELKTMLPLLGRERVLKRLS